LKALARLSGCLLLSAVALFCASCAGVKCAVKADQIPQPVSFTPCVYDAKGEVLHVSPQQVVRHFKHEKWFWAMMWRSCSLTTPEWDLSDALSKEIAEVQGQAVVNMTVNFRSDWLWYVTALVPIIPDYQVVVVEGDIARFGQTSE